MTQATAPKKTDGQLTTPEFRVSFPNVFSARRMDETDQNSKAKFSITMLFPKATNIDVLKIAVRNAVLAKWPDEAKRPKNLRLPFRDGAEKDYEGYGVDVIFCSATSTMKPGLVGPYGGPDGKVQAIIEPSEFYAGCYARATINAYAYEVKGNKGVAFGLRNIQKLRDGEPFSGRNKAENDFDAIEPPTGTPATGDPLAGL